MATDIARMPAWKNSLPSRDRLAQPAATTDATEITDKITELLRADGELLVDALVRVAPAD